MKKYKITSFFFLIFWNVLFCAWAEEPEILDSEALMKPRRQFNHTYPHSILKLYRFKSASNPTLWQKKPSQPKKPTLPKSFGHLNYKGNKTVGGLEDVVGDIEKSSQKGKVIVLCDFLKVVDRHTYSFVNTENEKIYTDDELPPPVETPAAQAVKQILGMRNVNFILTSTWSSPCQTYIDIGDLGLSKALGIPGSIKKLHRRKLYRKKNFYIGEQKMTTYRLGKNICGFRNWHYKFECKNKFGRNTNYDQKGYAILSILNSLRGIPDGSELKPKQFRQKFKKVDQIIFVDDSLEKIKTFSKNLENLDRLGFFPKDLKYKTYLVKDHE